jgi:hypothetical protein
MKFKTVFLFAALSLSASLVISAERTEFERQQMVNEMYRRAEEASAERAQKAAQKAKTREPKPPMRDFVQVLKEEQMRRNGGKPLKRF